MNRNRREIKIVSAKFVSHGLNSKHEETSSFMSNGKKSDRNELSRSILSHPFFLISDFLVWRTTFFSYLLFLLSRK